MKALALLATLVIAPLAPLAPLAQASAATSTDTAVTYKGNCLVYTEPTNSTDVPQFLAEVTVNLAAGQDQTIYTDKGGVTYHVALNVSAPGGDPADPSLALFLRPKDSKLGVIAMTASSIGEVKAPRINAVTLIVPANNNMSCTQAQ